MKKNNKGIVKKRNNILYFVNNLLCSISSMLYMFFVAITSLSIFPAVYNTSGLNDNTMLESIVRADMFIIKSFFVLFVVAVLFYVVNYICYRKEKGRVLWALVILSSLTLIVNIVKVIIFYI